MLRNGYALVTIFDLLGRQVYDQKVILLHGNNKLTIHPNLSSGVYIMNIGGKVIKIVRQ